ncbi:MAG: putative ABC transport system permease protein [Lentimonas sp.]|jgi:putative ABC transport system permease protein
MRFILQTAWRDARRQRSRLWLCALSIVFGVAALVAVDSFAANLTRAMDAEAKALLGADLQISSRSGFGEAAELMFDAIGGKQARETRFASMAYFPKSQQTRLVQVRALGGGFPFYGEFETEPAGANPARMDAAVIVLDPLIMVQYGLELGDTVRLGELDFTIIARLNRVPGEAAFAGLFAPRCYIPLSQLEGTGLIGTGSIAFDRLYLADMPEPVEQVIEAFAPRFAAARLETNTVEDRRAKIGEPLANLTRFLGLVGFVALLLGGVGIAGAVHAYLQKKRDTVAILRCLGSSAHTAFGVFLVQVAAIAAIGAISGAVLGVFCQAVLPGLLAPLLPFELEFFIDVPSIVTGVAYGFLTALLFGLFPLLPLRRISPLQAIRADFDTAARRREPVAVLLALLGAGALAGFCIRRTEVWWHGLVFACGLGLVALLLWLVAVGMKFILQRTFRPANFLLRQASANLHRPNNRTVYLTVSLGVGTFLIFTLVLIQAGLLQQTDIAARNNDPNLLFFDVQTDQYEGLQNAIKAKGMEIMEAAPVVTMRLSSVKGRSISMIKNELGNETEDWMLNREWRSSYRGEPGWSEVVVEGEYVAEWNSWEEPVPISMEVDMARDLGVRIGDRLVFDIQGIPMEVRLSSLRRVDWSQLRPNFFVTFPLGVLDSAPQWWIAVARSPDVATTAALQAEVFQQYPNISAVDLNVVLNALQNIFGRINFAIRFMGFFTAVTGIIILANAVTTSRSQRIRESVLLRTIGASGRQIRVILALEYALIGFVAAVIGVGLALIAASALGVWVFKVDYFLPWGQVGLAVTIVTSLAVGTGMLSSRGIASHPPLVILRREG